MELPLRKNYHPTLSCGRIRSSMAVVVAWISRKLSQRSSVVTLQRPSSSTCLNEYRHDAVLAVIRGQMKGSITLSAHSIHRYPRPDQCLNGIGHPLHCRHVNGPPTSSIRRIEINLSPDVDDGVLGSKDWPQPTVCPTSQCEDRSNSTLLSDESAEEP